MGMIAFFFWPLLFVLPMALFWLAWMGLFTLGSLAWIGATWRLWIVPMALMLIALVVVGPLLSGMHHVAATLISVALWIALPVGLGIWFARRYPRSPSPWEPRQ